MLHNQRDIANSSMPVAKRRASHAIRGAPGDCSTQEIPETLRLSAREGSEVAGDSSVATFGDRGAQGGEGMRPRILEASRRPSQVFLDGAGAIAYLPRDRFAIGGW